MLVRQGLDGLRRLHLEDDGFDLVVVKTGVRHDRFVEHAPATSEDGVGDGTNGGLLHGDDFTHIDVDGCGLLDEVHTNDETIVACLPE